MKAPKIFHYGDPSFTGNGNKKLACFKGLGRVKLGYKNKFHATTMGIFKVNCPLCIDVIIEKRFEEIGRLKILREIHAANLSFCQKDLTRSIRGGWNQLAIDPETMARLKAESDKDWLSRHGGGD